MKTSEIEAVKLVNSHDGFSEIVSESDMKKPRRKNFERFIKGISDGKTLKDNTIAIFLGEIGRYEGSNLK